MSKSTDEYREFYQKHDDICVFSAPWWLDVVAPDEWDAILINENKEDVASFVYTINTRTKMRLKYIEMPPLTQKLGPYIDYGNRVAQDRRIIFENKIFETVIDELPEFDYFRMMFDQQYSNWLPFCWHGYSQTTRYSYVITDLSDMNKVKSGFAKSKKYLLNHANNLSVKCDIPANDFYDYFNNAISERGGKVAYSRELFCDIYKTVYDNRQGKAFYCVDGNGNIQAEALIVWDNNSAYYLCAMRKEEYKSTGATELLTYKMIEYVSSFVNRFDFEGSMMKGVEASYRNYGSDQKQYFDIYKTNNKILKIMQAIRG